MTRPQNDDQLAATGIQRSCCPTAALMAWVFPGLGHIVLGQRRRGLLIMCGILFLFFCGLLIGGLDAVDMKQDRIWFVGQAFNGPIAFVADFLNQTLVQNQPMEIRVHRVGLAHVNWLAMLFITLGGLMNLVVILDAFYPQNRPDHPHRRSEDR